MDILPGQLIWGPVLTVKDAFSVNALELGDCPKYYVQHYSAKALSHAFGPFALDQILVFCRRLKALLASRSCGQHPPVQLTTKSCEEHTNACVLLGAYLVLVQGWPASKIVKVLGKHEAERRFVCSWQDKSKKMMPVQACWEGLEVAVEHGWINTDCLNDDVFTDFACSKFRKMVATFDASWLIPGKLLVCADPITTVHDPNPETFRFLCSSEAPKVNQEPLGHVSSFSPILPTLAPAGNLGHVKTANEDCDALDDKEDAMSNSTATPQCLQGSYISTPIVTESTCQDDSKPSVMSLSAIQVVSIDDGASSVETVCKQYEHLGVTNNTELPAQMNSFSDFLQDCNVKLMVRCNFGHEQGMPAFGYSADKFKQYGINHKDIQFLDKGGGLPERCHVAEMLKEGTSFFEADAGAVLVHCKGGFGRSVVLACCLAIHAYDIPGRALLGWVRIARPGAITTVQQEEFLISLKGSADVARFAGLGRCSYKAALPSCREGCAVQ